jgi:lipopolysaccharide transport system permease protein
MTQSVAPEESSVELPATPLYVIEGGSKWIGFEFRDLWLHRELFYLLVWRDVKVRYKQTILGAAWAILQPLLTMVIFTVLFGNLAHVPSEGQPYAIFSYAALLPWNFFTSAVTTSSNSLVGNANLITKVYFPRLVIPGAAVGAALVDFSIASVILFIMMAWYGVSFTTSLIMFLPLVSLTTLVAMAFGILLSAANVKYRDVRYVVPFAMQIWMFVTPVIYPTNFIPAKWRWALALNPLSGIVEGFRDSIFGRTFNWRALGTSLLITSLLLVCALYAFRRLEREFADII